LLAAPRSGLAHKHSIDVGAGVIDYDYRGNVGVILFNFSDKDFQISPGDRIAQLILERISMASVVEVADLDDTTRGAGGFGSTGVSANSGESNVENLLNSNVLGKRHLDQLDK
jgi:dUTP pyrophosphatase